MVSRMSWRAGLRMSSLFCHSPMSDLSSLLSTMPSVKACKACDVSFACLPHVVNYSVAQLAQSVPVLAVHFDTLSAFGRDGHTPCVQWHSTGKDANTHFAGPVIVTCVICAAAVHVSNLRQQHKRHFDCCDIHTYSTASSAATRTSMTA